MPKIPAAAERELDDMLAQQLDGLTRSQTRAALKKWIDNLNEYDPSRNAERVQAAVGAAEQAHPGILRDNGSELIEYMKRIHNGRRTGADLPLKCLLEHAGAHHPGADIPSEYRFNLEQGR